MATLQDVLRQLGNGDRNKAFEVRKNDLFKYASSRRIVNAWFRAHDESAKWPICNRFNATERAIRRVRRLERQGLAIASVLEYALAVDEEMSRIVNAAA